MISSQSLNILFLSERLYPRAKRIFRLVSTRHGKCFSMRDIVIGETLAFLASSALLIMRDSLIFFKELLLIKLPKRFNKVKPKPPKNTDKTKG